MLLLLAQHEILKDGTIRCLYLFMSLMNFTESRKCHMSSINWRNLIGYPSEFMRASIPKLLSARNTREDAEGATLIGHSNARVSSFDFQFDVTIRKGF